MQTRHKQAEDENFPVASLMIAKDRRYLVQDYYAFARYCDDVADNPDLQAKEKLNQLQEISDIFWGKKKYRGQKLSFAARLKNDFMREELAFSLAGDLLVAFCQDAEKQSYDTIDELIRYCQYSAAPVGRFMLALHDENPATYLPSSILCTALQLVNHLQDIKYDYQKLGRIYLPQEWMTEFQVEKQDLLKEHQTPQLTNLIAKMLELIKGQVNEGKLLLNLIHNRRLRYQVSIIISLTNIMIKRIEKEDVLRCEFRLSHWNWLCGILKGLWHGFFAKSRMY